jgi:hypothetical protein
MRAEDARTLLEEPHPSIQCLTVFGTYSGCFLGRGSLCSALTQDAFWAVAHCVRHLLRMLSGPWLTVFGTYSGCFLGRGSLCSALTQDAFWAVAHCVRHLLRMLSGQWPTPFGTYSGCFLGSGSLRSALTQDAFWAVAHCVRHLLRMLSGPWPTPYGTSEAALKAVRGWIGQLVGVPPEYRVAGFGLCGWAPEVSGTPQGCPGLESRPRARLSLSLARGLWRK